MRYPVNIRMDQEAAFKADAFQSAAEAHVIEIKLSGVDCHSSTGVRDRFNGPLRRVYRTA